MNFLVVLFLFTSLSAMASTDHCPMGSNPCDRYLDCVEAVYPCGDKGYAQSYGYRYCNRFAEAEFFNPVTYQWRDATRDCLIGELLTIDFELPQLSCERIKRYAFDSHPRCYILPNPAQPDLSICYLPKIDILRVSQIVSIQDAMGKLGRKQIKDVAQVCITNLFKLKSNLNKNKKDHNMPIYPQNNIENLDNLNDLIDFWYSQIEN